ncbi:MAG: beta-ketoacyl-ACP synthase II [Elusimicrobiota bacterium]
MKKRVVITGMGVVTCLGMKLDEYWNNLKSGKSGIGYTDLIDVSDIEVKISGQVKGFNIENYIEKKRARRMDRFVHFAIAASKHAVDDSGIDFSKEDPDRCSVMIGSGTGGLQTMEDEVIALTTRGPRRVSPFLIPKFIVNMASGEVAITFGCQGPNYAAVSACASGAHAMGDALRYMRYGDMDVVITGGAEAPITRLGVSGFANLGALSTMNDQPTKASRPFDKNRSGFVMSEGAGILVFETLEHAKTRGAKIYAEVAGYGATDDAHHITAPDPSGKAAVRAMQRALEDAELKPEDIDYINPHGTSTLLNDRTETTAIKKVFGEYAYKIPVSSTKSMAGHLLGAAGGIELIASVLCMNNSFVHPTINLETPDLPDLDLDYVPNTGRQHNIDAALSNSLGFGGHNAVLIIKKFNE